MSRLSGTAGVLGYQTGETIGGGMIKYFQCIDIRHVLYTLSLRLGVIPRAPFATPPTEGHTSP